MRIFFWLPYDVETEKEPSLMCSSGNAPCLS